jgi:hypothetical protein
MSFDLASLEGRFESAEERVDEALHSQVAKAIEEAAETILPLVPDGVEVEALLQKFDELAAKAHDVIDRVAPPSATPAEGAEAAEPVNAAVPPGTNGGEPGETAAPAAPADADTQDQTT